MITGFNTDIEFKGKVYHVQTEDKGLDKPLILSLVYTGGEILASKRAPYDDLIAVGFDESVLNERLKRQHKLICAAIEQGRIEDLKRMTERKPAHGKNKAAAVEDFDVLEEIAPETILIETQSVEEPSIEQILDTPVLLVNDEQEIKFDPMLELDPSPSLPARVLRAEPNEAVADFVRTEADQIKVLNLRLLKEREFRSGERVELHIQALHGESEPLAGADLMVKVLGSAFRPIILHAQTSTNGVAVISLQLPHFRSGRAALLIKAESEGYTAELRRIVTQS